MPSNTHTSSQKLPFLPLPHEIVNNCTYQISEDQLDNKSVVQAQYTVLNIRISHCH